MGQLSHIGRNRVAEFLAATAALHGAPAPAGDDLKFTVSPSVLQTLQELMVLDGSGFLQQINVMSVPEMKGERLFLDADTLVTGRTNTATTDRAPTDPTTLTRSAYELFSTEVEVAIKYSLIDAWAKFPNFSALWNAVVRKAIANDRVKVGWNGTSAATATNKASNPLGQDVNKGWLQIVREYDSGAQYVNGTGTVTLGSATYPNLDYLVSVARTRIPEVYRYSPDLVSIIGSDLAAAEEHSFFKEAGRKPIEKRDLLESNGRLTRNYGGLDSWVIPFFPPNAVFVTSFKNLSIYYQDTSWRRTIMDYPKRNQYEDFSSRNEGYVVEDERKTSLVDNISIAP